MKVNDDDEEVISKTVSHAQAFKALETVLTYADNKLITPMSTIIILNGLLMQTATKRVQTQKQTKLSYYFSPSTCTCNTN